MSTEREHSLATTWESWQVKRARELPRAVKLASAYSLLLAPGVFFPGFESGKYLQDLSKEEYNQLMIPSAAVRRKLLFAGCQDLEELQLVTKERISNFSDRLREINPHTQTGDFQPDPIIQALDFVHRTMEDLPPEAITYKAELMSQWKPQPVRRRRTGEEAIAHIYRTTLGMLDFIEDQERYSGKNKASLKMTGREVGLLLLLPPLHDFGEDTFERNQQGVKINIGATELFFSDPVNAELRLQLIRKNRIGETFEETSLGLEHLGVHNVVVLQEALQCLAQGRHEDGNRALAEFKKKLEGLQMAEKTHGRDLVRKLGPSVMKALDRIDNFNSYTFSLKEGREFDIDDDSCFKATALGVGDHNLLAKTGETLLNFPRLELDLAIMALKEPQSLRELMVHPDGQIIIDLVNAYKYAFYYGLDAMAHQAQIYRVIERLGLDRFLNNYVGDQISGQRLFNRDFARYRPTSLAMLILFGMSQDEIYGTKVEKGRFALPNLR